MGFQNKEIKLRPNVLWDVYYLTSYVTYHAYNYLINDQTQDRKKERKQIGWVALMFR